MSDLLPFAGFSAEEWITALTPVMGAEGARSHVESFHTLLELAPSNGFALDAETFALLALVSPSCARRVAEMIANYPAEFRELVEAHIIAWRSDASHQTDS